MKKKSEGECELLSVFDKYSAIMTINLPLFLKKRHSLVYAASSNALIRGEKRGSSARGKRFRHGKTTNEPRG